MDFWCLEMVCYRWGFNSPCGPHPHTKIHKADPQSHPTAPGSQQSRALATAVSSGSGNSMRKNFAVRWERSAIKIESNVFIAKFRLKIHVPAKESPINSTRSRELVDRQPGNMTLQHLQNLFKNKRSNLYLLGGLRRNKIKLSMCQYVRKMMDLAS